MREGGADGKAKSAGLKTSTSLFLGSSYPFALLVLSCYPTD